MKKVVLSCSCFIDSAVWFVNSVFPMQKFDAFVYVNDMASADVFIYEKKSASGTSEITVCCLECFEFLLTCLSIKEDFIDSLNKIDCLYVIEEPFCYNSFIYIGNYRFGNEEYESRSTDEILEKYFKKFPYEKSCFTSIGKYSYESFCFSCKEFFKRNFMQKLFLFEKK